MIIDKFLLCFQTGAAKVSKRMGLDRALSNNEIAIMYAIRRCPTPSFKGLHRYLAARRTYDYGTYVRCMQHLRSIDYIQTDERVYSVTPAGMEFLAALRRYLINIRL